jgi:Phosphatidate cytidylyltransferase, mitochondrial
LLAAANWVLPPNVFYAEQQPVEGSDAGRTLRAKVTVISRRDFERGCSTAWFESYIWGRFAQPTRILYARDERVRTKIEAALVDAARTLLRNALPALPPDGSLAALWEQALALSYTTELRTERSGRAQELVQSSLDFYTALTGHLAGQLGFTLTLAQRDGQWHYRSAMVNRKRHAAALAWALRRVQGKLLSILRLVKALFTFAGGLDYIAWKLERHSGVPIHIPDKVRRAPLIHMWPFFWGLYRRGIFK